MSRNKTIVTQETPNLAGHPSVNLRKPDFEALIEQKGYNVYLERNYRCPCRSKDGGQQLSSCKNCGGSGYLFINKIKTRMVLHSMNVDTQFKEWSQENIGTVSITARDIDKLSTMDRITLIDAESEFNQVLYPKLLGTDLYAYTTYDIRDVRDVFLYMGDDVPLKRLKNITDYTFSYNKVILDPVLYNDLVNPTITIRYIHSPQFHVIDIPRETININVKVEGSDTSIQMPINAIGRRSHYVLDQENFVGDRVIDNSYLPNCDDPSYTAFQSMIKNSTFEDIFNELTDNQRNSLDEEILKVINEVGSIHEQNTDTYLAIGTPDATSAHEIRLFLDNPPAGYTDAQARAAISNSATGLSYNSSTGAFSLTSGYVIPTTVNVTSWNSKEPALGNPTVDGYILTSTIAGVRSWVAITSPLTAGDGINITSGVISLDISDYTAPGYIQLTTTGSNRIVLTSANGFHAEGSAFMDLISGGLLNVSTAYAQFSFVGGIDFFGGNDFTTHFTGATTFNTSNFSINATSGISLSAGSGNFTLSHGAGAFNLNSTTASLSGSYGTFLLSQTNGLTVTSSMGSIALDSNGLSISDVNGNSILSNSTDFTITSIGIAKINGVDISLTSTGSVSLVSQSGTLILSDGTHVANITFAGMSAHYSYNFPDKGGTFAMTSDISSLVTGVSSVFGRTGAVVAAIGDYTFAQIASKPTTLSGYGITDAYTQLLTGYSSGSGTISSSDSILSAIQKLNGNIALVTGAVVYQGLWNASTNSPSLSSGVGTKGYMYKVSVAGTTSLDGISQWNVGDQVIFDGTTWDKIDGIANEVLSVNGLVGAVALTGTANRITVSGANIFDISSSYVGQASITTLGTVTTGVWSGTNILYSKLSLTGSIVNADLVNSSLTINGTSISLGASGIVTAAANTLTGTTLNSTVVTSSLTSVGTLVNLTVTNPITGSVTGNAATVTTNANLTGEVTSIGNAATLLNSAVIGKVLTGYVSGAGTVAATDTILQAIQKLNGNCALTATDSLVVHLAGIETITGAKTFSAALLGADGTAALPEYAFTNSPSSGMSWLASSSRLLLSVAGTNVLNLSNTEVILSTSSPSLRVAAQTGTNIAGTNLTIGNGAGTGIGTQSYVIINTPTLGTTGSTTQVMSPRLTIGVNLSNQTVAATSMIWLGGLTPSTTNYTVNHDGVNILGFNVATGGQIRIQTNNAIVASWNTGLFISGSTNSPGYSATNAASNTNAHFVIDPANSVTSGNGYVFDTTLGFILTRANGTKRIKRWSVILTNNVDTAGSESSDLTWTPLNTIDKFIVGGAFSVSTLNGSTTRFVTVDTNGNFQAVHDVISGEVTNATIQALLSNTANWTAKVYTGTAITGTYQTQWYYDATYYFFFTQDNVPVRMALV